MILMRCMFQVRYTSFGSYRHLLVALEGLEVSISDRDSGELLGTFIWENNTLTGDDTIVPEPIYYLILKKLITLTSPMPVQAGEPEEPNQDLLFT